MFDVVIVGFDEVAADTVDESRRPHDATANNEFLRRPRIHDGDQPASEVPSLAVPVGVVRRCGLPTLTKPFLDGWSTGHALEAPTVRVAHTREIIVIVKREAEVSHL